MKNTALAIAMLTLACCCTFAVLAQDDSSRLDIGYLHLQRNFTQHLSIKGADLEKMPFANLSDAIAAWLYGAYTQPVALQYVVDGNPVSDVNAYSVHDIEEVILVQTATAVVNTAGGQQEMVVIRTKRGKGPGGITAAAQTGLVNAGDKGIHTGDRWYHDYYIGAYRNQDKISYGVSANYLRDVLPLSDAYKTVTPDQLERWRLNGYFTWRPGKSNVIGFTMNYTSEQIKEGLDSADHYFIDKVSNGAYQHYILPHLSWHSDILPGLTNDLQATYMHSIYSQNDLLNQQDTGTTADYATQTLYKETSYHFWIRDRIGYRAAVGRWNIEPAVNGTYEHWNEPYNESVLQSDNLNNGGIPLGSGNYTSIDEFESDSRINLLILTPAVDVSYGKALDVQAGMQVYAGHQTGSYGRRDFPFASLSLDLLKWGHEQNGAGLSIYGSYSQRSFMSPQGYTLAGLTPVSDIATFGLLSGNLVGASPQSTSVYWVWQTGAAYTGWNNRLQIGYTFEQCNFMETWVLILAGGNLDPTYPRVQSSLQHADIRVTLLDGEGLRWQSGVNATLLRNKFNSIYTRFPNALGKQDVGDDSPAAASWTGGWVNRLQVRNFTAGFDLLYHFGETVIHPSNGQTVADTVKVNSVMSPNVYVGYRWRLSAVRALEFFLESRGLIRSANNDLLDERRYYTVGGKLSL
jgi:hypothetical protein